MVPSDEQHCDGFSPGGGWWVVRFSEKELAEIENEEGQSLSGGCYASRTPD